MRGGRVYGEWPGLSPERLWQGRDLAMTTDFRRAIGSVVQGHMKLGLQELKAVFPTMPAANGSLAQLIRT